MKRQEVVQMALCDCQKSKYAYNYFLRYYDGHASTLYVCTVLMKLAQAKFRTAEDNHTMK